MRILIIAAALVAAAILGASIYGRAFGAYGYTPTAEDAIAIALIGLLAFVGLKEGA